MRNEATSTGSGRPSEEESAASENAATTTASAQQVKGSASSTGEIDHNELGHPNASFRFTTFESMDQAVQSVEAYPKAKQKEAEAARKKPPKFTKVEVKDLTGSDDIVCKVWSFSAIHKENTKSIYSILDTSGQGKSTSYQGVFFCKGKKVVALTAGQGHHVLQASGNVDYKFPRKFARLALSDNPRDIHTVSTATVLGSRKQTARTSKLDSAALSVVDDPMSCYGNLFGEFRSVVREEVVRAKWIKYALDEMGPSPSVTVGTGYLNFVSAPTPLTHRKAIQIASSLFSADCKKDEMKRFEFLGYYSVPSKEIFAKLQKALKNLVSSKDEMGGVDVDCVRISDSRNFQTIVRVRAPQKTRFTNYGSVLFLGDLKADERNLKTQVRFGCGNAKDFDLIDAIECTATCDNQTYVRVSRMWYTLESTLFKQIRGMMKNRLLKEWERDVGEHGELKVLLDKEAPKCERRSNDGNNRTDVEGRYNEELHKYLMDSCSSDIVHVLLGDKVFILGGKLELFDVAFVNDSTKTLFLLHVKQGAAANSLRAVGMQARSAALYLHSALAKESAVSIDSSLMAKKPRTEKQQKVATMLEALVQAFKSASIVKFVICVTYEGNLLTTTSPNDEPAIMQDLQKVMMLTLFQSYHDIMTVNSIGKKEIAFSVVQIPGKPKANS